MTPAEAQVLLAMCATVDNRKPDEDAARAWAAMLDGLRFEDCRVAVIEHYKTSTEWLMPAKVRADVKRLRSKRITEHPPLIPPDLPELEERRWRREALRRIGDGEVLTDEFRGELRPRDIGDLRQLMPSPDDPPTDEYQTTRAAQPGGSTHSQTPGGAT